MEKHELIDIVGRGSKVRKSINSHLIIGENTPEYDRGDILDANATAARITSKVEEAKTYLKNYVDNNHKPVSDKFFYQTIDGEKVLVYIDPETGEKTYFTDESDNAIIVVDPSVPTFSTGMADVEGMENVQKITPTIENPTVTVNGETISLENTIISNIEDRDEDDTISGIAIAAALNDLNGRVNNISEDMGGITFTFMSDTRYQQITPDSNTIYFLYTVA